ncbi:hypothetical protein FS935_19770 [Metabacillus litoralis]|uniref:Uncharacterized protein n=1 Tax=Metabacillus litoralis TaxID=152268 RepID=A0A5C6VPS7_9BACI|nr:hypothetical protein [Metabacillus litoralis]TXC85745.1 hypothetical protein FS935_19770 [Metabacillus litoralis]
MIRNKAALIASAVIFSVCMCLYFPFPNNQTLDARETVMSFPIRNQDGYLPLGIIGSLLFLIALILLVIGMKKYHFRTIVLVMIVYSILPNFLISIYQETFASGISAVSYDGNGTCNFDSVKDDVLNGECKLVLHNRSNEAISFELEFLDSYHFEDDLRMESLMNINGPHMITIEANHKETLQMKEYLELYDVPNHIHSGTSYYINIKLIDGKSSRIL